MTLDLHSITITLRAIQDADNQAKLNTKQKKLRDNYLKRCKTNTNLLPMRNCRGRRK